MINDYYAGLKELGLVDVLPCTDEENEQFKQMPPGDLPPDVFTNYYSGKQQYFRYSETSLPEDKIQTLILMKTMWYSKVTRGCAVFFVVFIIALFLLFFLPGFVF